MVVSLAIDFNKAMGLTAIKNNNISSKKETSTKSSVATGCIVAVRFDGRDDPVGVHRLHLQRAKRAAHRLAIAANETTAILMIKMTKMNVMNTITTVTMITMMTMMTMRISA